MAELKVGVVDVFMIDPRPEGWKVLVLRRADGTRCTGAWEVVHGRIEGSERPEEAAEREAREETGLPLGRLYNVTCHPFYLHRFGVVQVAVVFAAFVDSDAPLTLGVEHDMAEWVGVEEAMSRLVWPRSRASLRDIQALLANGDAGPVEDVLRVR
ncbi:MAG: NUDIX domain-containing protein [Gemmatimonadota bacterium]